MSARGPERATASPRTDWVTPQPLFDLLDREFRFTLDAAASDANHKCERYLTEAENALAALPFGEVIWLNPPYGRLGEWVQRVRDWSIAGNTVVVLLPANTDTGWFSSVWYAADEIRFMYRRVQFVGGGNSNTGGSMVAVYRPHPRGHGTWTGTPPRVSLWDWRAEAQP